METLKTVVEFILVGDDLLSALKSNVAVSSRMLTDAILDLPRAALAID